MDDYDERTEELTTLSAIYPELVIDEKNKYSATLELAVSPAKPFLVRFAPSPESTSIAPDIYGKATMNNAYIEKDVQLSHLPPLSLRVTLPAEYPAEHPPLVELTANRDWLPRETLAELEQQALSLWEEYDRCQVLYVYVDFLQQAAERGFDLDQSAHGCLVLPSSAEPILVNFDSDTKQSVFDASTYDCGICLEPKKGSSCYRLPQCGHVFCKSCLQDFYNNAISEGDVASVKCLSPDCGKGRPAANGGAHRQKASRALRPRELLAIGLENSMVRRYVEMKRKKKLEADKNTVYCPRTWCQGPAKSKKYPPIPIDLSTYVLESSSEDESVGQDPGTVPLSHQSAKSTPNKIPPDPSDRLAVCEKCSLAFCRVCYRGWHGQFARCLPRDPNELSAEEKASYDYICLNTSPCPTCNSPTQKTMGCNHMRCFQCNTHFCYLCGAWLDGENPYQHFNKPGTNCYQRLWELKEGDEGQGPQDGRGFAGGRGWELLAIEAAREAEAQEAAAAAQAEEDERAARALEAEERRPAAAADAAVIMAVAQMQVNDDRANALAQQQLQQERRPRNAAVGRPRNPFQPPMRAAGGGGNAVRNHERNRGARGEVPRRHVLEGDDDRHQAEILRFLDMAERDEEDGWDSDELGDDDHGFRIR